MEKSDKPAAIIGIYFCAYFLIQLILILFFPGEGLKFYIMANLNPDYIVILERTLSYYIYYAINWLFFISLIGALWIGYITYSKKS